MVKALLITVGLLLTVELQAKDIEVIKVPVGSVREMPCVKCKSIQVSRKGIIQVVQSGDEQILHLVALRSGTVLLSIPDQSRHYLITVENVELTQPSKLQGLVASKKEQKYWLSVHLLQVSSQNSSSRLALKDLQTSALHLPNLQRHISELGYTAKTVALPGLIIIGGKQYRIRSGGEQASLFKQDHEWEYWKEYGFNMVVSTQEVSRCMVAVQYQVELSKPVSQSKFGQISRSDIQGYQNLACDHNVLIGTIDITSNESLDEQPSIWSFVPIIGPLFSAKSTSEAFVQLVLYMKVETHE